MRYLIITIFWISAIVCSYNLWFEYNTHWGYLTINVLSILVPVTFSFDKRFKYYKNIKAIALSTFCSGLIFIGWDSFFTLNKIWEFNPKYTFDYTLFDLPFEEILFFFFIPYASVFIFENTKYFFPNKLNNETGYFINFCLLIFLLIFGLYNIEKLYTIIVSIFTLIILLINQYIIKPKYLGQFYLAFVFVFVAFIIVDGAITGLYSEEAIVNYKVGTIIEARIFTIPYEDLIYCIALILININLFEFFKQKIKFDV